MKTSLQSLQSLQSPLRGSLLTVFAAAALFSGLAGSAQAAVTYATATVEGALTPGVYGRIEIGTAPPPPVLYAQPIIVQRTPVLVQQPLYLHVPPGHARKWSKHCARYNACGQPVYFVRVNGDDEFERRQYEHMHKGKYKEDKHDKHDKHEKKHGKGHGHDD